jgi:hypothetical protein
VASRTTFSMQRSATSSRTFTSECNECNSIHKTAQQ